MHAHDRTLLTNLGFADQDKRDSRHDLGCQYLAQSDNRKRLGEMIVGPLLERRGGEVDRGDWKGVNRLSLVEIREGRFEVPLSKGEGQYRTTIGFLDLVLPSTYRLAWEGEQRQHDGSWKPDIDSHVTSFEIVVEVKINPVSIGDIQRQINLYRQYRNHVDSLCTGIGTIWILATTYPILTIDAESLRSSSIHHVRLGSTFEKWCEWQRRPDGNTTTESKGSIVL